MAEGNGGSRDPAWWWKAAFGAVLALLTALLLKGLDEWQKTTATQQQTNIALAQLAADVKYQIDRVGQREVRLDQVEDNLAKLHERMQVEFEKRRELAQKLLNEIDDRLDRLELRDRNGSGGVNGR